MLIDLPPLQAYSLADCQDLFMSKMTEGYEIDGGGMFRSGAMAHGVAQESDVLSDAEPFLYTSSSESDLDACFSDIEGPMGIQAGEKDKLRCHSVVSLSDKRVEHEIALHSPGRLLGTPRDSSRRYEYPFPAHLQAGDSLIADDIASSTATTPGLTPAGGSSLGLLPLAAPSSVASRTASLPMYMPIPAPTPVPVSSLAIPATNTSSANLASVSLAPLSHVPAAPGPLSAPALSTSPIAAHPKLSRFNPANTPVPPGLRGRTRKSASVSMPKALQPIPSAVASVSFPTTTVGGS